MTPAGAAKLANACGALAVGAKGAMAGAKNRAEVAQLYASLTTLALNVQASRAVRDIRRRKSPFPLLTGAI